MSNQNFIAELKRRNVIRMAGLYLVGAWLIAQVAETILPAFEVPNWVMRAILIVLALGFLPAMSVAWIFELTPQGLKRDEDVLPEHSIAPQTARRMDRMLLLVSVLALGYFAFDKFALDPQRDAALVAKTTEAIDAEATAVASKVDPRSIAVLPFVNMSDDKGNEYFSDGISEELLNVLVRVQGFNVASRTSSFAFKGREASATEIAKALKVKYILEGSVRKQGDNVRITAQLIDSASDRHLMSQTYDRKLADIFKIQDEIANTIVTAVRGSVEATTGGKAVSVTADTSNLDAYQAYLKGRELFRARSNLKESMHLFEHAVELDPKFARAWESLAAVYAVIEGWGIRDRDYTALAEPAARRALELDSSLSMPWAALSLAEMRNRPVDWGKALDFANRAVKADPNNAAALLWRSVGWIYLGYFDKALADQKRCLDVDPAYLNCTRWKAQSLVSMGNEQAALQAFEDGVTHGFVNNRASAFVPVLVKRGDLLSARLLMSSMKVPPELAELLIATLQAPGRVPPNATAVMERAIADPDSEFTSQVGQSLAYIWLGDFDRAGAIDDPLNDNIDAWMPGQPDWRNSSGWKRKLNGLGVPAYWHKHGFPPQCRAVGTNDFTCDQPGVRGTVKP